jgi:hypothetical protein
MSIKKIFIAVWLIVIGSGIAYAFWHQEWKYSLPTPVPQNYHAINSGDKVSIKDIQGLEQNSKPLFLHFFNPNCPCSRFNITHFKSLVKEYGHKINFAVVALSSSEYTEKDIQRKFDLALPLYLIVPMQRHVGCTRHRRQPLSIPTSVYIIEAITTRAVIVRIKRPIMPRSQLIPYWLINGDPI